MIRLCVQLVGGYCDGSCQRFCHWDEVVIERAKKIPLYPKNTQKA